MISLRVNRNSQSVRDEILTEPAMPEAKSGSGAGSLQSPLGGVVMRGTAATVVATVGAASNGGAGAPPLTPPDVALHHPLHSGDNSHTNQFYVLVFYRSLFATAI